MDNRGQGSTDQCLFREGVNLGTVKAILKDGELVGSDIKAVRIGANQWLVAKAWAIGVRGRAICTIVRDVQCVKVPGSGRIAAFADGYFDVRTT